MLENLKTYHIILGSNSPRRKELLSGLGLTFEVRPLKDPEETYPAGLNATEIPVYIAEQKSLAYLSLLKEHELVITADTIVWANGEVLGKPEDKEEAMRMLKKLSGNSHQVITGVCLLTTEKKVLFSVVSTVFFAQLSEEDIEYYIDRYAPYDKAGGYGIQEWIGYIGVEKIEGSFYNVMGLPIQRVYQELKKL